MRRMLSVVAVMLFVSTPVATQEPSCTMGPATYISNEELQEYVKRAAAGRIVDQQVRALDVGKINAGIGLVHRTRLDKAAPASVAEHDLVGEIYHVISGSATFVTGPDLVDKRRRPADNQAVRMLNGPGNNAASIRGGATHQLKAGDVIVIPAGTGHWFTKIDDHITYLMIRLDPDKVVPLMDEAASKAYLKSPLPAGRGRSGGQ